MGRTKRTKKFALVKRMLSHNDARLKENQEKNEAKMKAEKEPKVNKIAVPSSGMYFQHNEALGPPYHILIDTNFINFSIKNKMDMVKSMMDCLFAKCIPCITDCVMAELEKLGPKYRIALRLAKDPRIERLPCSHQGTYADDCLVQRVSEHPIYIVGTMDKELRRRLRKVPGVPIMYIKSHKYTIERMPEAYGAPRE
jgi:U3 small nucleolar RNA-associated protein 24